MTGQLYMQQAAELQLAGRLDEALQCVAQAIRISPHQAEYHAGRGSLLEQSRRSGEAVAAYQQALALNPELAQVHNNLGNIFAAGGKIELAVEHFRRAIALQPAYADAAYNWANVCCVSGDFAQAVDLYRRAISLKPDFAAAYNNLGNALWKMGRLNEALAPFQSVIALHPKNAQGYNNLGNIYYAMGELDAAMKNYQAAVGLDAMFAGAHWNQGMIHLMRGEYDLGWPLYEWRAKMPGQPPTANLTAPMWDGGDLTGRHIYIFAEQGFGDCLQFMRYLPMLAQRGAKISLSCPTPLHRLLRQIQEVGTLLPPGQAPRDYDLYAPLLSLGRIFKTAPANIPPPLNLQAEGETAGQWRDRVGGGGVRKIGLAWAGKREPDPFRSAPLGVFAPLAAVAGIEWHSLQTGPAADEARPAEMELKNWSSELRDFADTAALIANLDLVITVDTAVAHLAATMGKPTWVLLKKNPDWRWMLGRADCRWYPSVRLFRQQTMGDWTGPVGEIVTALKQ